MTEGAAVVDVIDSVRRCDCGCRRDPVLLHETYDLVFSAKCVPDGLVEVLVAL